MRGILSQPRTTKSPYLPPSFDLACVRNPSPPHPKGKDRGDRHPKVRSGVLLGAGAKILGNVEIGEGAKVGAGSVVLKDVPPHTSVAGVPAEIIGKASEVSPALGMCHKLD